MSELPEHPNPMDTTLVNLAAASDSPGPLRRYATVAAKATDALSGQPDYLQAVFLAALMSPVFAGASPGPAEPGSLRPHPNGRHAPAGRANGRRIPPIRGALRERARRWLLPEELLPPPESRLNGLEFSGTSPAGWALLGAAAARRRGAPADDVAIVGLASGRWGAIVRQDGALVWLEGPSVRQAEGPRLRGGQRDSLRVAFNDAGCWTSARQGPRSGVRPAVRPRTRAASPSFDMGKLLRSLAPVGRQYRDPLDCRALTTGEALRREVFARAMDAPGSVYTLALYAHQTLLVHRPEAYALASVMSPTIERLARRLGGVEGVLAFVRRHVSPGSLFPEPDRVMLAQQVLEHGLARPSDAALLIFSLLHWQGYPARVVRTTRGMYVAARDHRGTRVIDASRLALCDRPEGVPVISFDAERQYGYRDAWQLPEALSMPPEPAGVTVA
ncbi:hypothetical protein U7230_14840 [Carboxydochorda subterranea]|uniref:Uncharacterized protein n=1 Tax=Carboxydichorda subterranea TaxID=3109565 RepID=A0ABZ1BX01_9FIRM|nr:hypothetical protein [Limnochorda sp. L945t]WRP17335.1 hypothetical protein U7230_14840 [Limnochorda sp. L945t]